MIRATIDWTILIVIGIPLMVIIGLVVVVGLLLTYERDRRRKIDLLYACGFRSGRVADPDEWHWNAHRGCYVYRLFPKGEIELYPGERRMDNRTDEP